MRPIKFRAWDKEKKRMLPVEDINWMDSDTKDFVTVWDKTKDGYGDEVGGYTMEFPVECILMQYTGLKDKNGKEIYEGDIVKPNLKTEELNTPLEVIYFAGGFTVDGWGIAALAQDYKWEVIGNIYSNPELIK